MKASSFRVLCQQNGIENALFILDDTDFKNLDNAKLRRAALKTRKAIDELEEIMIKIEVGEE